MPGRGAADNQHFQESCRAVRGAERARLPREGGQPDQGQGGEGDGVGRMAVRGGTARSLWLLSVPST